MDGFWEVDDSRENRDIPAVTISDSNEPEEEVFHSEVNFWATDDGRVTPLFGNLRLFKKDSTPENSAFSEATFANSGASFENGNSSSYPPKNLLPEKSNRTIFWNDRPSLGGGNDDVNFRPISGDESDCDEKSEFSELDIRGVQNDVPVPPPPPPLPRISLVEKNKLLLPDKPEATEAQKARLESLRSRPKRRPDWGNMMKEIETGIKLSHIKCNDRSAPLLPMTKAKGQFVYESERPNLHNQLLKQINTGVKLKSVKTNDRSKPFIEGLRKFRRQMTIEEQIQKSTSIVSMGIVEAEPDPLDEVDDIDKVRDDLQSTKQLLAMELKNKEALERENKKLMARILNMEVEMEKERNRTNKDSPSDRNEMKQEMAELRTSTEQAKKVADELETKLHDTTAKLDLTKLELEDALQKAQRLEKQLKVAQAANLANASSPIHKQPSAKKIASQHRMDETMGSLRQAADEESESESESETESESEVEEADDSAAASERRQARELKLLSNKLKSFKDKREQAKKERKALKEQTSKLQKSLRAEKKKYKVLQKEVDKMSKLVGGDDEDEDEEEEEEEESESESESEQSESESETESDDSEGDLPESAPPEKIKANLSNRVKRYENLVSSLKKGNYLLKANVERHRDEVNKQKEMAISLQEDLNSVLEELG